MIITIAIIVLFGIVLMMVETFLPGAIAGSLGLLCILAGVVLALFSEELSHWPTWGRAMLAIGIIGFASAVLLIWMRWFAVKLFHRAFTLETSLSSSFSEPSGSIGTEGVAITELRPLGRAEFDGKRRDVRCQSGFAPAGAKLQVIGTEPGNLLVRKLEQPSNATL